MVIQLQLAQWLYYKLPNLKIGIGSQLDKENLQPK